MTNNQLNRERLEKIKSWRETYGAGSNVMLPAEEAEELARIALAAMDSEPVAWLWSRDDERDVSLTPPEDDDDAADAIESGWTATPLYLHGQPAKGLELAGWQFKSVNGDWLGLIDEHGKNQAVRDGYEVREVFAMADGVNDRYQVRREHAEWSQATFGNVGPVGPLKHLAKEAIEAAAEPDDLSEWADMQFLMWDAQRRAGITDEQITLAMVEKLAVNKQRSWPEPKEGEPRLHIKEQPAPVVPEKATVGEMPFLGTSEGVYVRGWNDCRAAMLNHPSSIQPNTDAAPGAEIKHPSSNSQVIGVDLAFGPDRTVEVRYVAPSGYVMVPKDPTAEMVIKMRYHVGGYDRNIKEGYKAMLAAADCSIPMISDRWIPVSERMPEERMSVILWDAEIGEVTSGHYSHKTQTFYHCGDAIENEITHWMVVAAPQEVKGE